MAYGFKTGGRQVGTTNKVTIEQRDRAEKLLQLIESKYLEQDIAQLSPNQRAQLYRDILEYRQPKLSRTIVSDPNGKALQVKQVFMIGNVEVVLEGSSPQLPG
jgi:hypothetical protein